MFCHEYISAGESGKLREIMNVDNIGKEGGKIVTLLPVWGFQKEQCVGFPAKWWSASDARLL